MPRPRQITRWLLWPLLILATALLLDILTLAFPAPLTPNTAHAGSVSIHYDGDPDTTVDTLAANVAARLRANRLLPPRGTYHVYYFNSAARYSLICKLALMNPEPQGFNLSLLGNSYVSATRVAELARTHNYPPPHSIWEGDPAHTIAHEIAHQILIDPIGRGPWKALPHWKREGLPEYIANSGAVATDSASNLAARFRIFTDDHRWDRELSLRWDRLHYRAWLLIEYLVEVEGYTLERILDDSLTLEDALSSLEHWVNSSSTP